MTIELNELLPILLYLFLIILVIILIILGIKLIKTLTKIDDVIDDVNGKMRKVNGVFEIIDKTTDYASTISDKIVNGISNFVNSLFKKKKGNDDEDE